MRTTVINSLLILLAGLGIGLIAGFGLSNRGISSATSEVHGGDYQYINPLLSCEGVQTVDRQLRLLEADLQEQINHIYSRGDASHVSVYFRDLVSGNWFGIDENERFTPASLFKVPTLLAVLKKAESDPGLLERKLMINKAAEEDLVNPFFQSSHEVEDGQEYTIRELLDYLIRYSNNDAASALLSVLPEDYYLALDRDLALNLDYSNGYEDFMSVRSYASIFRVLYNASYLNREMSEQALSILTQSEFKPGLMQGIPPDIEVAHKFGERSLVDEYNPSTMVRQLHECGIVYYPEHPYLLCVMTRGNDFEALSGILGNVSGTVYEDTVKRFRMK